MVSLDEAKTAVLLQAGAGMEISEISELPTGWVFGLRNAETKEEPDTPPLIVYKTDGRVGDFFPPEHMAELSQMKLIEGSKIMRMYIPESELKNADNMQPIMDILEKVPDTDFQCMDNTEMTLDDAVQAIRELGEGKIADLLCSGGGAGY